MMKFKDLVFYLVISIALILSPAILFRSMFPSKALAFTFFGYVLGDEDESEEDEEDDDEDEDDENEGERNGRDEDDDDEDDDNDEDERDDDEQKETRTTKVNQDGTRTVTKKKVEDNGKVEIETKTYGVNGKVIEEYKAKDENGNSEQEYQAKVFSENGGKVSEIKYKSKDGEEFRLMIKNEDQSITKVKYDENHNYVRVIGRTSDNDELEDELEDETEDESEPEDDDVLIRSEDDETYELEHRGKKVRVRLPLTVDDATGDILLLTDSGEKSLQYLPDAILSKVSESDDSIEVSSVEIVEKDGKIAYELTAEKAQSVLGLFETRIDTLITYDAETGQELESLQSFWGRIVDAISF